jgi:hypothetical protein
VVVPELAFHSMQQFLPEIFIPQTPAEMHRGVRTEEE